MTWQMAGTIAAAVSLGLAALVTAMLAAAEVSELLSQRRERRRLQRMGIADIGSYRVIEMAWERHPSSKGWWLRQKPPWRCTNCNRVFPDGEGENYPVVHMYRWHRARGPARERV